MLALSLLLGAAAGVNAIIGGEVSEVMISENEYFCADKCVHKGVFFPQKGKPCTENEAVVRVNAATRDDIEEDVEEGFQCKGAELKPGETVRQPLDGELPYQCIVNRVNPKFPSQRCISDKAPSGPPGETVQWSDIEKEFNSATGQDTPQENKPAPQRSHRECIEIGQQVLRKCRQDADKQFEECREEGDTAILNCRNRQ